MLFSKRETERKLLDISTKNEIVDTLSYPLDEDKMSYMESEVYVSPEEFNVFLFLEKTDDEDYIDVYVWDWMMYPDNYVRFIITAGKMLDADKEKLFLYYADRISDGYGMYSKYNLKNDLASIVDVFPEWHLKSYKSWELSEAIVHMYFASFRSGIREILYKSELNSIAYNIDSVYEYDMFASSAEMMFGKRIPLKLLRILNKPSLVHYLYADDTLEMVSEMYKKYSGYITGDKVSNAQFEYLERLFMNNGEFAGCGFNRALYNKLSSEEFDDIVDTYGRFIEARKKLNHLR